MLLLGAYRLDEARTHPGLRTMVRSLQRLGPAEELPVGALGPEAVAALARALLGGEPPPALLGALRARAAGMPLFVTALIRGLRDTGELIRSGGAWVLGSGSLTALPPVVRDLVLARLERLDPPGRALLELVAVAGDAASPAVLDQAAGLKAGDLETALRRLRESGLVAEEPAGSGLVYRTAHPLVAEVAYGELPETRRRRLHAGVAAALEALRPADLEQLAHHYRGAAYEADPGRALEVLVAAGQRGEELHADAEAAGHFAAALALARTDRPAVVADLLERLGHARSRSGQLAAAVAAWSEAAGQRERSGDRPATARLRGLLALVEWDRGRFDAAEAQLAAGFQAVEGTGAGLELTDLHHIRLQLLVRAGDPARIEAEAAVLLALPERTGTRRAVAGAHLARADMAFLRGDFAAAREHGQQALAVAEQAGISTLAAVAYRRMSAAAANAGRLRLAREHALADLALAQQTGSPALELGARFGMLLTDMLTDAWEEVLRNAGELLASGYRAGSARGVATALAMRALVFAHRGRPEEAERCLAEAREVYGAAAAADRHIFVVVEIAGAVAALAAGNPERALVLAASAMATPMFSCLGLAVLGEAQVAAGDPVSALDTAGGSAGSGRTRRGRRHAGAGSRGWRGLRSASGRRRWPACGAPPLAWTGSGCRSRRPGPSLAGPRPPRRYPPAMVTLRRTGQRRRRRPAGPWPSSTGSAPARWATGPGGVHPPRRRLPALSGGGGERGDGGARAADGGCRCGRGRLQRRPGHRGPGDHGGERSPRPG